MTAVMDKDDLLLAALYDGNGNRVFTMEYAPEPIKNKALRVPVRQDRRRNECLRNWFVRNIEEELMKDLIRMKNIIGVHMSQTRRKILLITILLMCFISGCGEKITTGENALSVLLCEKLNELPIALNDIIFMPEVDMEKMNDDGISESDFAKVREKKFWNILKRLLKQYSNDYEIYATDNSNYALIVYWFGGRPSAPYWLYKENGEWYIEDLEVPDTIFDTGNVKNVELHGLSNLHKKILIIQTESNQGHGDTLVFQIENNRPQCIGYILQSVDYNWVEPMNATEIELYAGRGNLQVAFQDIDNDGFEEMLVYGRKLIYEVEPKDEEELREVEIVKMAYNMEGDEFTEISDPQYEINDILNNTGVKYYHLWGTEGNVDRQILEEVEADGTGTLYTVDWIDEIPRKNEVQTMESRINELEILPKRLWNEKRESNIYVATEQTDGKSRIYQIFQWKEEGLREVFVDEYRHYTLIDEETHLTLHRYNSYGCRIEDDMLYMYGSRLILDRNGNVCGVDKKTRKFEYVNGCFEPLENAE